MFTLSFGKVISLKTKSKLGNNKSWFFLKKNLVKKKQNIRRKSWQIKLKKTFRLEWKRKTIEKMKEEKNEDHLAIDANEPTT